MFPRPVVRSTHPTIAFTKNTREQLQFDLFTRLSKNTHTDNSELLPSPPIMTERSFSPDRPNAMYCSGSV